MIKLHHGECLDVLRIMSDASVDAIVTDPPYGLRFMGKRWDYDVPTVEIWAECLRVLKPGGHLLAFAGTRTHHRMAARIEDAGFEIRDMIAWVYSTGFPKSHNFGCKCRRSTLPYTHEEVSREQAAKRSVRSVCNPDVSSALDTCQGRGEVLQPSVSEQGAPATGWEEPSAAQARGGQSRMEGRGDVLAQARQLQADQVRSMPAKLFADGEEGRLHHGAPSNNGSNDGTVLVEDRSGASQEPRPAGQQARELRVVPGQRNAQANRMGACESCGGLIDWSGWGTALKPSLESVTVARKPLDGTVAENVLAHGTGALNIDGCRVAGESTRRTNTAEMGYHGRNLADQYQTGSDNGRWPANLIHDGSDEVVRLFPLQKSGNRAAGVRKGMGFHGANGDGGSAIHGSSGSAARFFYTAKADATDRNDGLLPDQRNKHPTVKPVDLMCYLCRLVTPPGGIVLDPFMGSGSTGKACVIEGFSFIGIERDADSFATAQARVVAPMPLFKEVL